MKLYVKSDKGSVRELNEDSYYADDKNGILFVADGMGGHNAGEIASAMAVQIAADYVKKVKYASENFEKAVQEANRAILELSQKETNKSGMGTTFTGIWKTKGRLCMAHVGDSRAYLYSKGILTQKSLDHTWVKMMVDYGALTYEEAVNHPNRHMITRAVGTDLKLDVDIKEYGIRRGDIWLIASDGLNDVDETEISKLLASGAKLDTIPDSLINMAINAGSKDNITVAIALMEEGDY